MVDALDFSATNFTDNVGDRLLHYEPVQIAGNVVTIKLHSQALRPGDVLLQR